MAGIKWNKVNFWLFVATALFYISAIATMIIWNTGNLLSMISMCILGFIAGCTVASFLSKVAPEGNGMLVVALVMAIFLFFSSWVPKQKNFVVLKSKDKIELRKAKLILPYRYERITYINDFTAKTLAVLPRNDKEARWDIEADINFIADYEQAFYLLEQFGSSKNWIAEVQAIFEQAVAQHIAAFSTKKYLPRTFSFSLTENQTAKLQKLGFEPKGEITGKNIRIFITKGQQ